MLVVVAIRGCEKGEGVRSPSGQHWFSHCDDLPVVLVLITMLTKSVTAIVHDLYLTT